MTGYLRIPRALIVSGLALLGAGASLASAGDEGKDVVVRIKAPLDASACTAAPPTITVLGLNIDTTTAKFEIDGEDDDHEGASGANSGTCSELTTGSAVEVKLVDDVEPLVATAVGQEGEDNDGASVQAPLQGVGLGTITLLGLTVDASAATLEGDDDDCEDGGGQPIDLTQLMVGQFVDVHLDASKLPVLVATRLEVKNFANQIEVEVDDENGDQVADDNDTVSVDAAVTVAFRTPARKGHPARMVRKTVHMTKTTNGRFVLGGLPKGVVTIKLTREVGGVKTAARRAVRVKPNTTRTVKMRLHKTHQ